MSGPRRNRRPPPAPPHMHTSNASSSGCYGLCFDPLATRREIRRASVTDCHDPLASRTPPGEKFGERLYAACHDPSRPPPHISSPPDYSAVHRAPQITKVLSAMALWKAAGPYTEGDSKRSTINDL